MTVDPRRQPLAHALIELLRERSRPVHIAEMVAALGSDFPTINRTVDALLCDGVLRQRPGNRYRLAKVAKQPSQEKLEGRITINPRGFGFIRPDNGSSDIFVPAEALSGAMHGDRVVATVVAETRRGLQGQIVDVLERAQKRVVGQLRGRAPNWFLEPDDSRIRGPIVLERPQVDSPDAPRVAAGLAAIVQLQRYPELPDEHPVGTLLSVLGVPGQPDVEVAKILLQNSIDETHDPLASTEAKAFGDACDPKELATRKDLCDLPLLTIDPRDARDHDDAIWVERSEQGHYRAWIAIADVAHYVTPGSALDAAARVRGASVYLPDRAVPMLPPELSSHLCSLLPGQLRLCMCVEIEFDPTGQALKATVYPAKMRSAAFLTYGSVARALGFSDEPDRDPYAEEMRSELRIMWDLAMLLRKRRMQRGALDFDLPEAQIDLDEHTRMPNRVQQRSVDPGVRKAYRMIEEMMIAANEAVARKMVERQAASIFRVHGAPDSGKLEHFVGLCKQLSIPFDLEEAADPKKLSKFLGRIAHHPKHRVLHMLMLRAMQQAAYDNNNIGHFGLASSAYLHFTSPIRRYPDLIVHRAIKQGMDEPAKPSETAQKEAKAVALEASTRERSIVTAERNIADLYRTIYMSSRIGSLVEGTVTAVTGSGLFVQVNDPFVVVFVRYVDLGRDDYEADESHLFARGRRNGERIELGSSLGLEVIDTAIARRTVFGKRLGMVATDSQPNRTRPSKRRRDTKGSRDGGRARRSSKGKGKGKGKGKRR